MNTLELARFKRHLLQEITFQSGDASDSEEADIASKIMYLDIFGSGAIYKKFQDLNVFDKNGSLIWNTKLTDQIQKLIKSKAKDIISSKDMELLVFKASGNNNNKCALVNPNANTISEYFIGMINISFDEDSKTYSDYSTSQAVDIPFYQITWSDLAKAYRGKGIGKQLYTLVYEWTKSKGAGLASDSTLYEGSARMWTNYMPQIASYFGVLLGNIVIPISKEEAMLDKFKHFGAADGFAAFENPSKTMRKILYNLKGLTYSNGDIFIIDLSESYSVNSNIDLEETMTLFDIVEESSSMKELLDRIDREVRVDDEFGGKQSLKYINRAAKTSSVKATVFTFKDSLVIVKSVSTGEEEVLPKNKRVDKDGNKIKPKKLTRLVAVTI
tara:strand:- start:352 stop:1506 length:1155 start_codon:yes stop_codon:yes gene_type:complete